ncbi:MAG: ABC transporter substrate-binding protein [Planctomycetota bacterium]
MGQWRLNTIGDIQRTVRELPATLFPPGPARLEAEARAATLLAEIARALEPTEGAIFTAPVMLVASVEPVLVFGRDTYLDDILSALGGTNAVSRSLWPELSLEDVIRIDPEAIVLVRPDETTPSVTESIGGLQQLDISAVREGRIAVLAHPDTLYPSTGIIEVAGKLRAVLGELAQAEP